MRHLCGLSLVCFLALTGCAQQPAPPAVEVEEPEVVAEWLETSPEMMTATQRAQQELVLAATNALVSELMGELMAALDAGDPKHMKPHPACPGIEVTRANEKPGI